MIHQFRRANTIGLSPARSSSASNANSKSPTYLQVKQLKMKATIDNSRMNFLCVGGRNSIWNTVGFFLHIEMMVSNQSRFVVAPFGFFLLHF